MRGILCHMGAEAGYLEYAQELEACCEKEVQKREPDVELLAFLESLMQTSKGKATEPKEVLPGRKRRFRGYAEKKRYLHILEALGEIDMETEWDTLEVLAMDPHPDIRQLTAEVLLYGHSEKIEKLLLRMTYDENRRVRAMAVKRLFQGACPESLERLKELLQDKNPQIREYAVISYFNACVNQHGYRRESVELYQKETDNLVKQEKDPAVYAAYLGNRYLSGRKEALNELYQLAKDRQEDAVVYAAQIADLCNMWNQSEIKDMLTKLHQMELYPEEEILPGLLILCDDAQEQSAERLRKCVNTDWPGSCYCQVWNPENTDTVRKAAGVWLWQYLLPINRRVSPSEYPFYQVLETVLIPEGELLTDKQGKEIIKKVMEHLV